LLGGGGGAGGDVWAMLPHVTRVILYSNTAHFIFTSVHGQQKQNRSCGLRMTDSILYTGGVATAIKCDIN